MAGPSPRLSGLAECKTETQLFRVARRGKGWCEETIDWSSMHEVCTHEAGEVEGSFDAILAGLSKAQDQEGDEGDGDLDSDGVLGCP